MKEALEAALEALTNPSTIAVQHAIELIRQALAQPEHMTPISPDQYERLCFTCGACVGKPWVGLTDDEINGFDKKLRDNGDYCSLHFAWGISAKLKEKNT